jgi:hypothetical protein
MVTKRNMPEALTRRQRFAIPHLLSTKTDQEGCEKAGISRKTLYQWLKDPVFSKELGAQREIIITEALEYLKGSIARAVQVLVGLLDTVTNDSLRRLLARDILEYSLKAREQEAILTRIERIEKELAKR